MAKFGKEDGWKIEFSPDVEKFLDELPEEDRLELLQEMMNIDWSQGKRVTCEECKELKLHTDYDCDKCGGGEEDGNDNK